MSFDTELYELLSKLGRLDYLVHSYQLDRDERPEVVAFVRKHGGCADVLILHGIAAAYAYRTPAGAGRDVLYPAEVLWDIAGKPVRATKALLALPLPGAKAAPTVTYPAQHSLCLAPDQRRPLFRIRRRGT